MPIPIEYQVFGKVLLGSSVSCIPLYCDARLWPTENCTNGRNAVSILVRYSNAQVPEIMTDAASHKTLADKKLKRRIFPTLAAYFFAALGSLLVCMYKENLWFVDWGVPLNYMGDSIFALVIAKSTLLNSWYINIPQLGAPFGANLADFPIFDAFHILLIKGLTLITGNPFKALNYYYVATFAITAITSVFVLRQFGATLLYSALGAILYTCTYFHFRRGIQHIFLSSYYLIPLICLVFFWLSQNRSFFYRPKESDLPRMTRYGFASAVICLILGASGVYYAFFAGLFIGVCCTFAAIKNRSWAPLWKGGFACSLMFLTLVLSIAPNLIEFYKHGYRPNFYRSINGVGTWDLANILLPIEDHVITPFADFSKKYRLEHRLHGFRRETSKLSLAGVLGFFIALFFLIRSRFKKTDPIMVFWGSLSLVTLIVGLRGGIGEFVAANISANIRCYDRLIVYLLFFSIAALILFISNLKTEIPKTIVFLLFFVFLIDQIGHPNDYKIRQTKFYRDRDFVSSMESRLRINSAVLQLPVVGFPEGSAPFNWNHLKVSLHSKTTRWSHGLAPTREPWKKLWLLQRDLETNPEKNLQKAWDFGFDAIYVDLFKSKRKWRKLFKRMQVNLLCNSPGTHCLLTPIETQPRLSSHQPY